MSAGTKPPSPAPPAALTRERPTEDDDSSIHATPVPLPREETGDEAYLRRLALTQSQRQPLTTEAVPQAPPPPPTVAPSPPSPPPLAYNPFAPPSVPPPPPGPPGTVAGSLEEKVKAAAAIAAKLGAMVAANPTGADDDDLPFEEPGHSELPAAQAVAAAPSRK
jgi:splicing factor 45